MLSNKDAIEIIEALRPYGYPEVDIQEVVIAVSRGYLSLSDVADFVQAMEEGDDDEAFMCAAQLGLA